MTDIVIAIICAVLGSSGLFSLIQFLFNRKDSRKRDITDIKSALVTAEKDSCRTQMLVLIKLYPNEKAEIMKLAKHYFHDLDGDWYLTSIFKNWLDCQGMELPHWFNGEIK